MYSWLLIRRLRGPAFLILIGINALLNQWGVLSFHHSWPLYLILAGLLSLAERAALVAAQPVYPAYPYGGLTPSAYPGVPPANPWQASASPAPAPGPTDDPQRRT